MEGYQTMMVKNRSDYTATIGIECHVQLKTKTKLFAAVRVAEFEDEPNTAISQICLGMPGALPVLNEAAVKMAARAAYALNTEPQPVSKFDRKHYFYPDLPKGYQITQFDQPIILGGHVNINLDGESKKIKITRAHLEEDAGKTIHPPGKDYSLVDLNRAGTPLLEIVSEPDMHSAEEARAFAHELYLLMRYADVSDADLYQGNMRFDVNVSVSKDPKKLGTRSETKNLNSFRSVEKATEFEIDRQIEALEKGKKIVQETRGWNEAKQKTFSQRSKEDAHDYRYFPEPDVPPLNLEKSFIDEAKKDFPEMPNDLRAKLRQLDLDDSAVETLVEEIVAGKFIQQVIEKTDNKIAKRIANWLTSDVQGLVAKGSANWSDLKLELSAFEELAKNTLDNKISSTNAKQVVEEIVINGGDSMVIAEQKNLLQVSDEAEIQEKVTIVLEQNPQAVTDLKAGQEKVIGFLVGQVMKLSKGQADPKLTQELIRRLVNEK